MELFCHTKKTIEKIPLTQAYYFKNMQSCKSESTFYSTKGECNVCYQVAQSLFCYYGSDNHDMVYFFQDALLKHAKCAEYHGSIWTTRHQSTQDTHSPEGWDWTQKE